MKRVALGQWVAGGDALAHPKTAALLALRLLETRASAVLDISELKSQERHAFVRLFLGALLEAPKSLRHPVMVAIDEALKGDVITVPYTEPTAKPAPVIQKSFTPPAEAPSNPTVTHPAIGVTCSPYKPAFSTRWPRPSSSARKRLIVRWSRSSQAKRTYSRPAS